MTYCSIKTLQHCGKLIGLVMLFAREVVGPINEVENKEAPGEAYSRNNINLFGREFIVFDPDGESVRRKARGQYRSRGDVLCSFYSSK